MYHTNQLSVYVKLPLTVDFGTISDIKKAVQVFPSVPELEALYIVYFEDGKLEDVKALLEADAGIESCEMIPMRNMR